MNKYSPRRIIPRIKSRILSKMRNITLTPPGEYSLKRTLEVYNYAFSKAFEFIKLNHIEGDIAEFGTNHGFTARIISSYMKKEKYFAPLHLFDSFEGLPLIKSEIDKNCYEVKTYKVWASGSMKVASNTPQKISKALSKIIDPELLHIHVGFFDKTLTPNTFKNKLSLAHIDCDLYQSTKHVLNTLFENDMLEDGAMLLFDDYNCSRANPNFGERKALAEALKQFPSISCSHYYYYGWHGAAFIYHKNI